MGSQPFDKADLGLTHRVISFAESIPLPWMVYFRKSRIGLFSMWELIPIVQLPVAKHHTSLLNDSSAGSKLSFGRGSKIDP